MFYLFSKKLPQPLGYVPGISLPLQSVPRGRASAKEAEKKVEKKIWRFRKTFLPLQSVPEGAVEKPGGADRKKLKKDLEVSKKVLTFAVRSPEGAVGIPKRI